MKKLLVLFIVVLMTCSVFAPVFAGEMPNTPDFIICHFKGYSTGNDEPFDMAFKPKTCFVVKYTAYSCLPLHFGWFQPKDKIVVFRSDGNIADEIFFENGNLISKFSIVKISKLNSFKAEIIANEANAVLTLYFFPDNQDVFATYGPQKNK